MSLVIIRTTNVTHGGGQPPGYGANIPIVAGAPFILETSSDPNDRYFVTATGAGVAPSGDIGVGLYVLQLRIEELGGQLRVHWSNYEDGTGGGGNFTGNGLAGTTPATQVFATASAHLQHGETLVRTAPDATSPAMLSGWLVKYLGGASE